MRNEIPFNNVPHDYNSVINTFVKTLAEKQAGNLQAILLTGSYARGDATPASDLDVWCLFSVINIEVLIMVGKIVRSLPVLYDHLEVNAQCLSISEFECGYFFSFVSPPVIYLESVLLFGNYSACEPTTKEIESAYKKIFAEVLLSVRHYICVGEPKEKLTYPKIHTFILKPLMFALRLERFLNTGRYPLSIRDLRQICSPTVVIFVDWFMQKDLLEQAISNDHYKVLSVMAGLIENFL